MGCDKLWKRNANSMVVGKSGWCNQQMQKKGCTVSVEKKLFQHYQTGTTRIGFLPRRTSHSVPFPGRPRCGLFKSLLDSHLSWYQVPLISMILLLHCDYQYYYNYYVHIYIYICEYIYNINIFVYIYSICMLYL